MQDKRDAIVAMFSAKGARVNTNRGDEYYNSLQKIMENRLNELE